MASSSADPALAVLNKSPTSKAQLPGAPNSKPKPKEKAPIETYVYRDFANAEPSTLVGEMCHGDDHMPPQSLQSQKLPSKLNAMLSDPGEFLIRCGFIVVC